MLTRHSSLRCSIGEAPANIDDGEAIDSEGVLTVEMDGSNLCVGVTDILSFWQLIDLALSSPSESSATCALATGVYNITSLSLSSTDISEPAPALLAPARSFLIASCALANLHFALSYSCFCLSPFTRTIKSPSLRALPLRCTRPMSFEMPSAEMTALHWGKSRPSSATDVVTSRLHDSGPVARKSWTVSVCVLSVSDTTRVFLPNSFLGRVAFCTLSRSDPP
mmetsp:Transcript_21347/g.51784  ORF Transcript_21347/g.51784 Transcript_21347/m.51784 type:complete len:223 (-) Transcript_21347:241-909(-)